MKFRRCVSLHVEELGNGVQLSWANLQKFFIDLPSPANLTFLHVRFVKPAVRLLHGVLKPAGHLITNTSECAGTYALREIGLRRVGEPSQSREAPYLALQEAHVHFANSFDVHCAIVGCR